MSSASTYLRLDRANLGKATVDPEGILRAPAVLAVPGVYPYRTADGGIRRELVTAEVLVNDASISTLEGVPVVFLHPGEDDDGLITPTNAHKYAAGAVAGRPTLDTQGQLCARLVVHRADVIERIVRGTREVSCGYMATVVHEAGVWEDPATGERVQYDARQTGRRYNHVAIVPAGRHGARARVYLDSQDGAAAMVGPDDDDTTETGPEPAMTEKTSTVRIDGAEHQMDPALAVIVAALVTARDANRKEAEKLQGRVDALEAELKQAKEQAEKARTDASHAVSPERLQARMERLETAVRAGVPREEAVKLDDLGLMRAVVVKRYPDIDASKRTDAAIEGMYELAVQSLRSDMLQKTAGSPGSTGASRNDAGGEDVYEAFVQRTQNAWRNPTKSN